MRKDHDDSLAVLLVTYGLLLAVFVGGIVSARLVWEYLSRP